MISANPKPPVYPARFVGVETADSEQTFIVEGAPSGVQASLWPPAPTRPTDGAPASNETEKSRRFMKRPLLRKLRLCFDLIRFSASGAAVFHRR